MRKTTRPLVDNLEKWVPVSDLVEVSDEGRVRLLAGALLASEIGHGGYLYVSLPRNGRVESVAVHTLMAQAFLQGAPNVRFKNKDRADCRLTNLVASGYKAYYRARNKVPGKRGPKGPSKVTPELLAALPRLLKRKVPKPVICRRFGISRATLYRCLKQLGISETPREPPVPCVLCGCTCRNRG